jgi:GNAT superfamily N-acetyltransferase
MALTLHRHADAHAFLERAESWLLEEEIERAVPLQTALHAYTDPSYYEEPTYWVTLEDDGRIVGCAFRTPPHHVFVTRMPAAAVPLLLESLKETYTVMSGVSGAQPTASELAKVSFADRWTVQSRQWLWELKAVDAPDTPGALRFATTADLAAVSEWRARDSAMPLDEAFCARLIDAHWLFVWEDGEPCCLAGVLRHTDGSAALGLLYTPPELRGKGYGTAAVAAWSQQALDRRKRCFFYTNAVFAPTTAICRKLGHELVHESVDIEFR